MNRTSRKRFFSACRRLLIFAALLPSAAVAAERKDLMQLEIEVAASCGETDYALAAATDLLRLGYNVVSYRADEQARDVSELQVLNYYRKEAEILAGDVPGKQEIVILKNKPEKADIVLLLPCRRKIEKKPTAAAPDAGAGWKALEIAVVNGCALGEAFAELAAKLIRAGFDVVRIDQNPEQRAVDKTKILFRAPYEREAAELEALLGGEQQVLPQPSARDAEPLVIVVGCDLKKVELSR